MNLLTPTVLAAVISLAGVIAVPWLGRRWKRLENGRIERGALQLRGFDAVENLLAERSAEIVILRTRIERLEAEREQSRDKLVEIERILVALDVEVTEIHERLVALNHADLALRAVRLLDQVRRGRGIA